MNRLDSPDPHRIRHIRKRQDRFLPFSRGPDSLLEKWGRQDFLTHFIGLPYKEGDLAYQKQLLSFAGCSPKSISQAQKCREERRPAEVIESYSNLDLPGLIQEINTSLMDWSSDNRLAILLGSKLFIHYVNTNDSEELNLSRLKARDSCFLAPVTRQLHRL